MWDEAEMGDGEITGREGLGEIGRDFDEHWEHFTAFRFVCE